LPCPFASATFNRENLFSRSKILNSNDTPEQAAQAAATLKAAEQLKKIENVYDAASHTST